MWSTFPSNPAVVAAELRTGWLTFVSETERRRVGPIPTGWENFSVERLELTCRVAKRPRDSDPALNAILTQEGSGND